MRRLLRFGTAVGRASRVLKARRVLKLRSRRVRCGNGAEVRVLMGLWERRSVWRFGSAARGCSEARVGKRLYAKSIAVRGCGKGREGAMEVRELWCAMMVCVCEK